MKTRSEALLSTGLSSHSMGSSCRLDHHLQALQDKCPQTSVGTCYDIVGFQCGYARQDRVLPMDPKKNRALTLTGDGKRSSHNSLEAPVGCRRVDGGWYRLLNHLEGEPAAKRASFLRLTIKWGEASKHKKNTRRSICDDEQELDPGQASREGDAVRYM